MSFRGFILKRLFFLFLNLYFITVYSSQVSKNNIFNQNNTDTKKSAFRPLTEEEKKIYSSRLFLTEKEEIEVDMRNYIDFINQEYRNLLATNNLSKEARIKLGKIHEANINFIIESYNRILKQKNLNSVTDHSK